MKKYVVISSLILAVSLSSIMLISSCAPSQKVQSKTGIQLWGENCGRCHNAPGPGEFSSSNWEIVGRHMRIRTNISETEEKKIIEYLKTTAN